MVFSLGKVSKMLLIGGGEVLARVASIGLDCGLDVFVVTSSRHLSGAEGEEFERRMDQLGVRWICAQNLRSGIEELGEDFGSCTLSLSLSNPWIVSDEELTDLFGRKLLNCHGTRLPMDRGAGGFSWRILAGNRYGCVNLYQVTSSLDAGPVLDFEEFIYPGSCRIPRDFENFYFARLIDFLKDRIRAIVEGNWEGHQLFQPDYLSTYWPRLKSDENGWIDWAMNAAELSRFICAFDNPYGGARTTWNNNTVIVRDCLENYSDGQFHPFQAGIVYRKTENWVCVAANDGNLVISDISFPDGTNVLNLVKIGDRLMTDASTLNHARLRSFLKPEGWGPSAVAIN